MAAIVIEPVQGEGGYYPAPASFLRALRELCDANGILLIAGCLFPNACMRNNNALFIAIEFDHHELGCFISTYALAIFFSKMTVRRKTFKTIWQLYNCTFIVFT